MDTTLSQEYEDYKSQGRIVGRVPQERIRAIRFPRVSDELIARCLKIKDLTTSLSDALDIKGINGAVATSHIAPLILGKRVVGHAVTLRSIPERKTVGQCYQDNEALRMSTRDAAFLAERGDVLVCDFGGNRDISNLGGNACEIALERGIAGTIVHGAVRDASTIRDLDYPTWASGITPVTGKFRIEAMEINGAVILHGIVVQPGDLIAADDSGICVIPASLAEEIVAIAEKLK
jgi:regulator of RNase E activity RraA